MSNSITFEEAARFYECDAKDIAYYIRLGGEDPRKFIPQSPIEPKIYNHLYDEADRIILQAEAASCLENQAPTQSFVNLCRKILAWQKVFEQNRRFDA